MQKRFLAALLAVLMVANICACNYAPRDDTGEEPFQNTDTTESNIEETDKKATESEQNAETKPPRKSPVFYNGASGNSGVTYTFDQNNEFSVHIADWGKDHLVNSLSDKDVNAVRSYATAVAVNNERAFLILTRFYESKITVVSFEKGSQSETVADLDANEFIYEVSGCFINETVGYLFAFKEAEKAVHSRGSSELSNLFKTEDGGKTWTPINVRNAPLLNLREHIIFAKMISEEVGIISGDYGATDCNFCERTLLTTDGGLNWVNLTDLPQIGDLYAAKITDFMHNGEYYILTVRQIDSEAEYVYTYKSQDLKAWSLIS